MSNNKTTKRNEKIWVRIIRAGYIPQLGMQGPIPNPIQITRGKAHSMIVAGIDVFEIDPISRKSHKLTIRNVFGVPKTNNTPDTSPQKPPVQNSSHNKENQNNSVSFSGVPNNSQKNNNGNGNKDYQKGQKNPTPTQQGDVKTDKNGENNPEKK